MHVHKINVYKTNNNNSVKEVHVGATELQMNHYYYWAMDDVVHSNIFMHAWTCAAQSTQWTDSSNDLYYAVN